MSERIWQRLNYFIGILSIGMVFGLMAFLASIEIKDLDLWLHLKTGKYITENHIVPANDILSCSISGRPWVNHEWLFQVLIYNIWQHFGFNGLINMQIVVVMLTFLILLFIGYSKDRQFITAATLLLILFVYQTRFTIRPDIFSLLFFVSFLWILSWFINRRWSLWALVIIQILWTNMHGFFFFGPLLVLIGIVAEFIKRKVPLPAQWNQMGRLQDEEYSRLKKLFPLLLLACCINPLTFKGAWYPIGVLLGIGQGSSKIFFQHITELQKPITWETLTTTQNGYFKSLIVLSGMSLVLNRRKIDISTLFIWISFLAFSLIAVRNMIFFAVAGYLVFMANISTINWHEIIPFRFSQNKFKSITGLFIKGALIFWMIDTGTAIAVNGYFDFDNYERKSEFWDVSKRAFPYHGADFLADNQIKGNFFNDFNSGAYLIGRCFPNIKVYIDGRTEVYGGGFFERYQKIWRDGDKKVFQEEASKYNITGAFLNNNNQEIPSKVLKMFYGLPDWKIVYFAYDAVIFLKDVPSNKVWIDRFGIDLKKWEAKPIDLQRLGTKRMDPFPLTNRAYLFHTLGLDDQATKEVQEALKISPDDFDSYKLLGGIYGTKGDHRRAFENFRIACLLKPYDPSVRGNLALAYENLRNFNGAIEQYNRLLEIEPSSTKGNFGLGRCYAAIGQEKKALEYLAKAKSLAPEDKVDVQKIRDIIEKRKNRNRNVFVSKTSKPKDIVSLKKKN